MQPLLAIVLVGVLGTAEPTPYDEHVRPLLDRHCVACHGPEKPKGGLRLDTLSPDFSDKVSRDRWLGVLKRVAAGEMPPAGKARPSDKETSTLTTWITGRAEAFELARRKVEGRVASRRLNRVEYENTVRDLLGVEVDLQALLPEDMAAHGFDNVADGQHVSSFLMDRYLEAADKALSLAVANMPQPPLVKKRYFLTDERHVKVTTEDVFRKEDGALGFFCSSAWQAVTVGQFYPPDRGRYRVRISASAVQSGGKPVSFQVLAGPMLMATKNRLVGYFDAPAGEPTVFEFVEPLEARSTINLLPYGLTSAQAVNKVGAAAWDGPGLAVQWVEVEGPLHDAWPPESHRRIFGDLPQEPAPLRDRRNRVEVASKDPEADAKAVLTRFARRAFRRTPTEADVAPYFALVKAKLAEKRSFEQAVRVGLLAMLVSPEFLYLREKPGRLDDFALASRLSYFLWSTMPDDELLSLAEKGKLTEPEVLRGQVERLLNHPKALAFTKNFVGQWLSLRDIDFTEPSHILYPEFDAMLKASMVRESELFFAEMLKADRPISDFIASDWTMLNGRLAKHYGIGGIDGWEFRKVSLPPGSHRGGVLTMASVLKVTANGTTTSPVARGVWVLDRILGQPAPPPPADVPAIEPDIRGAVTIRDQLAKHRQLASCAACHAKIDPAGFALESFDVIGGYREHYRTTGRGQPVTIDGRRMHYLQGPKIDPADVLADGRKFADIDEFKRLLLTEKDQVLRALAVRLVTYATGGAPSAIDAAEVEGIVKGAREEGYGLRTLVHEVTRSALFKTK